MESYIKTLSGCSSIVRDTINHCTNDLTELPLTFDHISTIRYYLESGEKEVFYTELYKRKGLLGLFELLNIADFLDIQELIVDTCKIIEKKLSIMSSETIRKHLKETDDLNEEQRRRLEIKHSWL